MSDEPVEVSDEVLAAVRSICASLPETVEEAAWVGTRWRVRSHTFAHVLVVANGWPPAYAKALGSDGPATLLMFRSVGDELGVLRAMGPPFFAPPWRADEVGMVLGAEVEWEEIGELIADSYCAVAPKKLAALVTRER